MDNCLPGIASLGTFADKSGNFRRWSQSLKAVATQVWGERALQWLAAAKNAGATPLPFEKDAGGDYAAFAQDLWLALLFKIDGQPWAATLTMGTGRGCELWRALQHEYDPVVAEHAIVLEQQLMQLKPITDRAHVPALLEAVDALRMRHLKVLRSGSWALSDIFLFSFR